MVDWIAAEHPPEPAPVPIRDGRWKRRDAARRAPMADLLQLLADAEQAGQHVSTTRFRKSALGIGRHLSRSDVDMRLTDALDLLLGAEALGLLGRKPFHDGRGVRREAWALTPAGRMHIVDAEGE
jgi:hypothetical protein